MSFLCTREGCYPDTTCVLGYTDRTKCEHWKAEEQVPDNEETPVEAETSDIPWNGYVLGMNDLAIIGGRGRPAVIGLMGPPDSGKTSLLTYLYMWLLKHGCIGKWMFAGSWTLGGWESLVQYSRWTGDPPPTFPPHTSSTGRHPGILHLAMRCPETGQLRDIMLTDAPGEWFTQWSRKSDDTNAEGARWIIRNADALLVLIDSDALADVGRLPATRRATRDLIERVAAQASCPVTLVWAKADVEVSQPVTAALQSHYMTYLLLAEVLHTTIKNPNTIAACFERALAKATSRTNISPFIEPRLSGDPFLSFRGTNDNT